MRIFFNISLIVFFLTGFHSAQQFSPVRAKNGMVVSASRIASEVGVNILKSGGNAIDAAVAVGFALAVTYPSAGNIGGGGFMVIHFSDGKSTTIDFREKAPIYANEKMFLDSAGNFLPQLSQESVLSAGVPGSVAGLLYALEKYGTLPLKKVLNPSIELAEKGFVLDYKLAQSINYHHSDFLKYPSSAKIFTKNGQPFEEGDLLIQKDLAKTLKLISKKGRDGFYKGEVADKIVNQMRKMGGIITYEDLENYKPIERKPIISTFKGYKVITMGPPSGGGVILAQSLNVLENYDFLPNQWNSSFYIHRLVETLKYAFADRSKHLGDSDYYPVPLVELLNKDYAQRIFSQIGQSATPSSQIIPNEFPSNYDESLETTHYSVADKYGNVVSVTTTINSSYGSKIVVEGAGFLLNNEMDDFSSKPGVPNQFGLTGSEANKIEPGKRMLSSMTPTIVLKDDKPLLVLGSPGGSTIPTSVLQVIMNYLIFNMNIQEAVNAPRIHHQWLPDRIDYEDRALVNDVIENLVNMNHHIGIVRSLGRVDAIAIEDGVFYGATDPRGFGGAVGY
jgi:gamma-glutamyltranspeptidase/glutathione hydrolase